MPWNLQTFSADDLVPVDNKTSADTVLVISAPHTEHLQCKVKLLETTLPCEVFYIESKTLLIVQDTIRSLFDKLAMCFFMYQLQGQ